jgi:hypothetical protein
MVPPFGDTGVVTESRPPDNSRPGDSRPANAARRRDRTDDIFGDVLPDTTSDERTRETSGADEDSWYLENRPPHHDR